MRAQGLVSDRGMPPYPYAAPLLIGLLLRCVAAAVGYGWFALDDYTFVIDKGAAWATDSHIAFDCDYRSTLMPRFFAILLRLATAVGCRDPASRLQLAYGLLGALSCLTIVAVYHIAYRGGGYRAGRAAAWLAAAYALMPRICTRALLESAAMVPLAGSVWALVASIPSRPPAPGDGAGKRGVPLLQAAVSGALCGLAAMLRFQVGILAPVLALWALLPNLRWRQRSWRRLGAFIGGCQVAVLAQGALDRFDGRLPLSTPWAYVQYNLAHAWQYGESPFVTYFLQFVVLALPPACLLLLPALARACRAQGLSALLWVVFVLGHSVIRHKEDRFMFPILPLFFVIVGHALAEVPVVRFRRRLSFAACRHTWGVRLFWGLNALGVGVATLSDGQRNWTQPFLQIARSTAPGKQVTLALIEPDVVPLYYLNGRAEVQRYESLAALGAAHVARPLGPEYILVRAPPQPEGISVLRQLGCGPPQYFGGDFVDRLLVAVNRHNLRRAPTQLYRCAQPT